MRRSNLFVSACVLVAAQAGAPAALAAATTTNTIEELVVTAQKREAGLQDVAAAITALGRSELEMRGVGSVESLTTQVPNVTWGEHAGSSLITVRGVGTSVDTGVAEPNVAIHIDGVYLSRSSMAVLDLQDLQRIEVLRGPQGTLYGRNSTGGAINMISAPPTASFTGELRGGAGNYGQKSVSSYISGPLAAGVLGRVSAYVRRSNGYVTNIVSGRDDVDRSLSWGVRGALHLTPKDDVTIDLSVFRQAFDQHGYVPMQLLAVGPGGLRPPALAASTFTITPHEVASGIEGSNHVATTGLTSNVVWAISGDLKLRSVTGYVNHKLSQDLDGDATPYGASTIGRDPAVPRATPRIGDAHSFSQELNLSGSVDKRIDFLVGAFYFDERFSPSIPAVFPNGIPGTPLPPGVIAYQFGTETTRSYAFFTDDILHVTDRLRLTAGVRYSHDQKRLVQSTGLDIPGVPLAATASCVNKVREVTNNTWTPRAVLEYDVSDGVLAYGQYAKGFRQGGFNISGCNDDFEGETVDAFEGGLKTTFADKRATLNLSAFHYDYTNLQTFQIVNSTATINNAPATVTGAEAELFYAPSRALQFNVALAYLDATYGDFVSVDSMFASLGAQQLRGNRLNRAPKFTASGGVEFTQPAERFGLPSGGEVSLRAEVFTSSSVYYRPFNTAFDRQAPYTLVNLFAEYRRDDGLKFRAWAKNVGDTNYLAQVIATATFNSFLGHYAPPRTFGLEIIKSF